VNVAAALVDASQIVLDAAVLVLEGVRKAGRAALWLAQQGLNALEALVKFGLRLAAKILEGAFRLFYLNEFSFDFQLSRDSKYLRYHLDCTLFGKRIILDSDLDFRSVSSAIKSLVRAVVDVVKAIFKNNKNLRRRGIAEEDAFPSVSQRPLLLMGKSSIVAPPASKPVAPSRLVAPVRRRPVRRDTPPSLQSVCEGTCICRACIGSVKRYFALLLGGLMHAKGAARAVRRAALVTDSMNTANYRAALVAEEMLDFNTNALERRAVERAKYASVEEECADSENVSACVLVTTSWEADLDAMAAPDPASIHDVMADMAEEFAADDFVGRQYHQIADDAERLSWRDTVTTALANVTANGIGCQEFACVDVADCAEQAANYLLAHLEAQADDTVCPNGYTSDTGGGCDRSAALVQQHATRLASKWRPLVSTMCSAFVPESIGAATLSDAIELVYKARAVLGMLTPSELCEGRTVVADTSEALSNSETNMRATASESRRAVLPAVPNRNSLLHQLPIYSSICAGSGLTLTDGVATSTMTIPAFSTCSEESPYVEIPTATATFISIVRVSKQCNIGQLSDPAILGLQIRVKTHAGEFVCGDGVGTAADAACDGQGHWERACDLHVPATSVVLARPGGGVISFAEVEADGHASIVSNVLLGQPASSTSQCHERPAFKALGVKEDMYPTTPSAVELLVDGRRQCLEACARDASCVAVSFFTAPFFTPNGNNCIISPNALLGDDVIFVNVNGTGAQQAAVTHFSQHVPFQRLEAFARHVHGGPLLAQACVADLADCKAKCAANVRCTGFTMFGDEDDRSEASVCAMTGAGSGTMAFTVFSDGPFAQLPAGGISTNLGRPPQLGESSVYNVSDNYAIVLGLDKLTDGFYQPLTPSLEYTKQGFLHTCGETDSDEVVIPTTERSSVHTVRVWRRCDCCEHRAVGLQVMQQVETHANADAGPALEWRACGGISIVEDATCGDDVGPEMQYWQRSCNHTLATTAIKIVRVANSSEHGDDLDHRSIDLPEIEAFGSFFVNDGAPVDTALDADLNHDPETIMARYYATSVPTVPDGSPECGPDAEAESIQASAAVMHIEPLLICAANIVEADDVDDDESETVDDSVGNDDPSNDLMIGLIVAAIVSLLLALLLVVVVRRKRARAEESNDGLERKFEAPTSIAFNPVYDDAAASAPPNDVSSGDNEAQHTSSDEAVTALAYTDAATSAPPNDVSSGNNEAQSTSLDDAVTALVALDTATDDVDNNSGYIDVALDEVRGAVGHNSPDTQETLQAPELPADEETFGFELDDAKA
jgi:hypothetical protein